MRKITPSQMRKIHALAKEYGMDRDLLHSLIESEIGKTSIKELTIMEAVKVIDRIEGKKQSVNPGKESMTFKQRTYMFDLCKALGWTNEDDTINETRLNGFCRARYNCPSYTWLTRRTASKVIEGLKVLLEREEEAG